MSQGGSAASVNGEKQEDQVVVSVEGLCKQYGDARGIEDVSFDVRRGEIFGLLGPNGAGKTTTIEIIEGHRTPTSGTVRLLGQDPAQAGRDLHDRMGVMLQSAGMQYDLSVTELLDTFRTFYGQPYSTSDVIDMVRLGDKAKSRVETLSGGQRRRLDLALALVGRPDVLFLDEPTTGFDPVARQETWELLRRLRGEGSTTIILNTHLMPEAEALCDRVGILREGRLLQLDAPGNLRPDDAMPVIMLPAELSEGKGFPEDVRAAMRREDDQLVLRSTDIAWVLADLADWALRNDVSLDRMSIVQPGLEETYIALTAGGEGR